MSYIKENLLLGQMNLIILFRPLVAYGTKFITINTK